MIHFPKFLRKNLELIKKIMKGKINKIIKSQNIFLFHDFV